jgi:hypothetical protein
MVKIETGFTNRPQPPLPSQGFQQLKQFPEVLIHRRRRELGVNRETGNQNRRPVPPGLPGKALMVGKLLHVPGAGRSSYTKTAALFLGGGKPGGKVKGVGVGITGHENKVTEQGVSGK